MDARCRRVLFGFITAIAIASSVQPAATETTKPEERIAELERAWNDAHLRGDVETLDRLWASDLTVIVPGMRPFNKSDLLGMWRSVRVVFSNYSTSDETIHVYGGAAVVTGRLHRSRDFGGRTASEDWLFTKTYALFDGQWRVVAYHASVAPTE